MYEILSNGKPSAAKTYRFKSGSSDGTHYPISSQKIYSLDFKTDSGTSYYNIDVDIFPSGSNKPTLIGNCEFKAK